MCFLLCFVEALTWSRGGQRGWNRSGSPNTSPSEHNYTHWHTHTQQLQVHFLVYSSLLLIHIRCFPHTTHTQIYGLITSKAISNIASKLNQKVLLKHMPDLFSEHRPVGSCLYSLKCLHILFFKAVFLFLNATFALISSHDYSRQTYIFLKSTTKCLWVWKHSTYSIKILLKRTHTTHHTKMKLVSMQKCMIILLNKLNKIFCFAKERPGLHAHFNHRYEMTSTTSIKTSMCLILYGVVNFLIKLMK